MLQPYKILTVTHKRVNLKQIGDYVVKSDFVQDRLNELKVQFGFSELLYLATCNRVLYLFTSDAPIEEGFMLQFFQAVNPQLPATSAEELAEIVQAYEGRDALAHLFEVAASMDSLVIGERQILRQLRESFEQCEQWGLTGNYLRLAVNQAVRAAKDVYAKTRIGDKPVSVVSLAIQKMLKHHLPKDARILLIGAGQTNTLAAKFLVKHHFEQVTVFNRSLPRARQLAQLVNGRAFTLDELETYSEGFDAMIVCTGSNEPLLTPQLYHSLLAGETDSKIVVDLAIPHNVAHELTEQSEVEYIEIEGLRHLAKENLAFREQEVQRARHNLQAFLDEFPSLLQQRKIELAMRQVPQEIKAVRAHTLNEVFRKEVETLDENTREFVDRMLAYMEKKCIGIPMRAAREAALDR